MFYVNHTDELRSLCYTVLGMRESERFNLARTAAEAQYMLLELSCTQDALNLDLLMRRLKDLSAYSLTHAEISGQREFVELLALAMFFGATSDTRYRENQKRLAELSPEVLRYQGSAEIVEVQIATRREKSLRKKGNLLQKKGPQQGRLF